MPIRIGQMVRFIINHSFAPGYTQYYHHDFKVVDQMPGPDGDNLVALECIDDPRVVVDGYVHVLNLCWI